MAGKRKETGQRKREETEAGTDTYGKIKKEKEFARTVREELERKEEQKKLHKKHEQIAEDVVIVEKSHVVKFLIKSVAGSIRICAAILLCILAVIGLTALIYPEVRRELLQVLSEILMEGQKMIRMG